MLINIRVLPRSSKNEVIVQPVGSFKIKLTAAPVEGEANEALIKLLSKHFDAPKNKISITKGLRSKNKVVEILL